MFTQREDHLPEGNMLIHSWYRLGRGTPHEPMRSVTGHPRQRWNERLAGNYRRAWPPGLGTLKSQILSCSNTNPWETRSLEKLLCWHFNSLPCFRSREPPTPSLPHPGPATERELHSALLLTTFSTSCCLSGLGQLYAPPPHPNEYQKCPGRMSKILELLQHKSLFLAFFLLNSENWKINSKFPFSL